MKDRVDDDMGHFQNQEENETIETDGRHGRGSQTEDAIELHCGKFRIQNFCRLNQRVRISCLGCISQLSVSEILN